MSKNVDLVDNEEKKDSNNHINLINAALPYKKTENTNGIN